MAGTYTQRRSLNIPLSVSVSQLLPGGSISTDKYPIVVPGSQVTRSFRTGALADKLEIESPDTTIFGRSQGSLDPTSDTGHEFYSRKESFEGSTMTLSGYRSTYRVQSGYWRTFTGPVILDNGVFGTEVYPLVTDLPNSGGQVLGTRLISQAMPTKPEAAAAQMIGELLADGLPSLMLNSLKGRSSLAKSAGKDYLNVEFGWKPLISDLSKLIRALKKANAVISQYERDSGRWVRRRISLPAETSVSEKSFNPGANNLGYSLTNLGFTRTAQVTNTSEFMTRTWFSGAFTYFVGKPDKGPLGELERYEQLGNKLLGTRITPALLWELAPWSWLADWFFNIGDLLSNAVAFQNDGLVMRYGYLMRRVSIKTTSTCTFVSPDGLTTWRPRNVFLVDQKERMQATPYGFGVSFSGFSLRQTAILAALGLSKS